MPSFMMLQLQTKQDERIQTDKPTMRFIYIDTLCSLEENLFFKRANATNDIIIVGRKGSIGILICTANCEAVMDFRRISFNLPSTV